MSKRPAYQWYPGDFKRDLSVAACSFEARSLWREMLDMMHDGEPYGHLTAGGMEIEPKQLASMIGKPVRVVSRWLAELEGRKVFSRTEGPDGGIIYSRRMVRDEHIRNVRAASGKLGGNPALLVNQTPEELVNKKSSKSQPLSTATAVAVAVPTTDQVAVAARGLTVRANQGLAEHPTRRQSIPAIIATSGTSHTAAEAILAAGVPLDFAESVVYETAKTHGADGKVTSLKYFTAAVIRAWESHAAAADVAAEPAPSPRAGPVRRNGRGPKEPPQQFDYSKAPQPENGEVRWQTPLPTPPKP